MSKAATKPMDILEQLRKASTDPANWDVVGIMNDAFDEIVKTRSQVNVLLLGSVYQFADEEGNVWYSARGINRDEAGPIYRSLDEAIALVCRCHSMTISGLLNGSPVGAPERSPDESPDV